MRGVRKGLSEHFLPKAVTVLREGYGIAELKADALAGLTVAIVALPLSMAIAIASGVGPERGLYAAIVGGFLVSLLGGSRFQIGGPAGAFIVLISATVGRHGVDGMLLATFMSGFMLMLMGWLRLGSFIRFIPFPVTVGFTVGIAVIIMASQIKDLLGLTLAGPEPGPIIAKFKALAAALPTVSFAAVCVAALSIAIILACKHWRPRWPGLLIAVVVTSAVAWLPGLPVETIGSRFGGIASSLPAPHMPVVSLQRIMELLPAALAFTLLGGIESLLSAVVADGMSGRRHRSNGELVAQGAANVATAIFGGVPVTGTIARTATNVRAGAKGPMAGMLHAVFLLLFMLIAAPLAAYIPLAALAGLLATVAWNMAEREHVATIVRASRSDALVLVVTLLLVVFEDLSTGIVVGFSLAALLFLNRMAQAVSIEPGAESPQGNPVAVSGVRYDPADPIDRDIALCRVSGAFFFGAAGVVSAALDRLGGQPRAYVLDFAAVPMLDTSGGATIEAFARKAARDGAALYISGASPAVRRTLLAHGVQPPHALYAATLEEALGSARIALRVAAEKTG